MQAAGSSMKSLVALVVPLLLALALSAPALAARLTLSGEVTSRERVDLPPGATLTVRLVDLAAPDVARVEATAVLASPGKVPLTFSLSLDSALVSTGRAYGLVAEISEGDAIWFTNAEPHPVDALGQGGPVSIVTRFTGETGGSAPASDAGLPAIIDITWQAESIHGSPVHSGVRVTLLIAGDMRAGGRGGCNSWFAQTHLEGEALAFSAVAATRIACTDPEVSRQEDDYFMALAATRFWRLRDDKLVLVDGEGMEVAQFGRSRF